MSCLEAIGLVLLNIAEDFENQSCRRVFIEVINDMSLFVCEIVRCQKLMLMTAIAESKINLAIESVLIKIALNNYQHYAKFHEI